MDITITLPETHSVTSNEGTVELNLSKLPPELISRLVLHGATQKIADAAANASKVAAKEGLEVSAVATSLMAKVVDRLESGNWGAERLPPLESLIAAGVRSYLAARAKKAGKTLPKAKTPEYVALAAKVLASPVGAAIKAEAERKLAEQKAIAEEDSDELEDLFGEE